MARSRHRALTLSEAARQAMDSRETVRGLAAGVPYAWREAIRQFVDAAALDEARLVERRPRQLGVVQDHAAVMTAQLSYFKEVGRRAAVVEMRDGDEPDLRLPTPVLSPALVDQVPRSWSEVLDSYDAALIALADGGLTVREVAPQDAQDAFKDRVAEFTFVQLKSSPPAALIASGTTAPAPTVITTRRSGDAVLRCLGYFTSTALAIGTSQVVTVSNLSGRYSFGISDHGHHKYDPTVWSCPHNNVSVPLP